MCILCVCIYTLLKVVSHYALSFLSMLVMGFQKEKCGHNMGGWGELYPDFFFLNEHVDVE